MTNQPQPPGQYPVGAIVNGYVWTGTQWVPAQVMAAPPQPIEFKAPLSAKFQRLPVAGKIGVFIFGGLAFAAMVWVYSLVP